MKPLTNLLKKLKKTSRHSYRSGWGMSTSFSVGEYIRVDSIGVTTTQKESSDSRIVKKPVEVFEEIITEEPKMDLTDLKRQIEVVRKRMQVLNDYLGESVPQKDEKIALAFLKARQKYSQVKDLFKWAITTSSKIDELCTKYKLRWADFASYYKNVPMEGIEELEKYAKTYAKVRDDEPCVGLIIDDGGKEQKKDPILIAGSPFGNWFYILGAWDKEVEYIDDLVYHGK